MYEGVVQDLIDELGRLPGVGPEERPADRVPPAAGRRPPTYAGSPRSSSRSRRKVRFCSICFNVSEDEQCRICRDPRRDPTVLCVVEEYKDVVAIERTREFRGRYHVLGGAISPIDGIGPEQLRVRELMMRLSDGTVTELILATDPNLEGEATATYLTRMVKDLDLTVTRLASGLPVGGDLEYADEVTLGTSLGRKAERTVSEPDIEVTKLDSDTEDFAQSIADSFASFLLALREIAREGDAGRAISLLLLEISQISLTGARLGAQRDFEPRERVPARRRPRVRPRRDAAAARRRCSTTSTPTATCSTPTCPRWSRASSPTTSPASPPTSRPACATTAQGDVDEALWWWQFSYVSSWGNLAGVVAQRAALGRLPRPAGRRVHRRGRGPRRGR